LLSNEFTDEVSLFHKKAVNGRDKIDLSSWWYHGDDVSIGTVVMVVDVAAEEVDDDKDGFCCGVLWYFVLLLL
jgi:hypothetical protein